MPKTWHIGAGFLTTTELIHLTTLYLGNEQQSLTSQGQVRQGSEFPPTGLSSQIGDIQFNRNLYVACLTTSHQFNYKLSV